MVTILKFNKEAPCQYCGLSEDNKPAEAPVNSLFLELDTCDFYYFDGTQWAKVGGSSN